MPQPLPQDAAEASALVQQFLLHHGARYTSRATEENWRTIPVTLSVPEGCALPPGSWLVVPWQLPSADQLAVWLDRLAAAGPLPRCAVLTMDTPMLVAASLQALSVTSGVALVAVSAVPPQVYGAQVAAALQDLLDDGTRTTLDDVNPLEHLYALGDPRDPEVFVERMRRAAPRTPVTRTMVWANALLFLLMVWTAHDLSLLAVLLQGFDHRQLAQWGANSAGLTQGSGAWRLLASAFLHGNLLHIGMNLLVLRQLGPTAERLFGSLAFVGVYLLSALGGSIASLGWHAHMGQPTLSVGASGAIFGVMGATVGFALARRDAVPPRIYRSLLQSGVFFTVVNVGLGLSLAVVDNAAHLGGLFVGLASGAALSRELPPAAQRPAAQVVAIMLAGIAVLGLVFRWVSQRAAS
jgi:membrane associated rhomboid family serine protease